MKKAAAPQPYHHGDLRAALLEAGEAELAERGIEAFSLRGVARRAGVSHAAPAHHFGDAGGLLTALATEAFRRFVQRQQRRQSKAPTDPLSQLVAAGQGYIDFALEHPALFRLMFSSGRPSFDAPELVEAANAAFDKLERDVKALRPDMTIADVQIVWSLTHGLADLLNGGRMKSLADQRPAQREATVAALLRTALGQIAAR